MRLDREGRTKYRLTGGRFGGSIPTRGGCGVLEGRPASQEEANGRRRDERDSKTEGDEEREKQKEKERRGGKGGQRAEAATRAHVCATTSQADTDDGRPCLVTSPARLDGIHLFVRPLPAPFVD